MPIYEYACSSCGFEKDYLQKMSDPVLTECPQCNKSTLYKKLSAPGFQLKGSGWYATDFKGGTGNSSKTPSASDSTESAAASASTESSSSSGGHTCGQGACGACA